DGGFAFGLELFDHGFGQLGAAAGGPFGFADAEFSAVDAAFDAFAGDGLEVLDGRGFDALFGGQINNGAGDGVQAGGFERGGQAQKLGHVVGQVDDVGNVHFAGGQCAGFVE